MGTFTVLFGTCCHGDHSVYVQDPVQCAKRCGNRTHRNESQLGRPGHKIIIIVIKTILPHINYFIQLMYIQNSIHALTLVIIWNCNGNNPRVNSDVGNALVGRFLQNHCECFTIFSWAIIGDGHTEALSPPVDTKLFQRVVCRCNLHKVTWAWRAIDRIEDRPKITEQMNLSWPIVLVN